MKSLPKYIREGLRLSIDDSPYTASPTTWDELRQIIEQRYEELGPGTAEEPIDFNDIDVSKITTFYDTKKLLGMFEKTEFEYIDISYWDVSKVEDMEKMFNWCKNLKSVGDISDWDVSNVRDMNGMFYGCRILKSVGDLSNWDISNGKDTMYMFSNSDITNIPSWYKE